MQVNTDASPPYEQRDLPTARRRRCCTCCCVYLKWWLLFLTLLILCLGLTIGLLYPRDVTPFVGTYGYDTANVMVTVDGFKIPVHATVGADNQNYFDVGIDATVQVTHPLYHGFFVDYRTQTVLNRRANTSIDINTDIVYSRTFDIDYRFIQEMMSNCTSSVDNDSTGRSSSSSIVVQYNVRVQYTTLLRDGVIEKNDILYIPCPASF